MVKWLPADGDPNSGKKRSGLSDTTDAEGN